MHNLWLSWLCVKYGSRLGIYKQLQLPRLFITTNHRQSSRFFRARAAFCLGRCERLEERRINEICGLCVIWFFLKQKALCRRRRRRCRCGRRCCYVINLDVLGCRCRCETASEHSHAGLTGVWGPSLAGNPTMISMMSLPKPKPAERDECEPDELHQFASLLFACFLLQFAIQHLPLTSYHFHLPLHFAAWQIHEAANWFIPNEPRASSLPAVCR